MSDPFLGEIRTVGFNFAPVGWSTCAGQLLGIAQNSALFALFGTMYGGNGQTTFGLPNLQGRVVVDVSQGGSGLASYPQGAMGGVEQVTLTQAQLPAHTHAATFTPSGGGAINVTASLQAITPTGHGTPQTQAPVAGSFLASAADISAVGSKPAIYVPAGTAGTAVNLGGLSVTASGGVTGGTVQNALAGQSLPTPILQPYLVLLNIVAMNGIFPSRQ